MSQTAENTFDPMDQDAGDPAERYGQETETIVDKAEAAYSEVTRKVYSSKRAVRDYFEEKREPTADVLDRTASTIRNGSNRSMNAVCDASERAAGRLERVADYIRSSDTEAIFSDSKELVRRNPAPFIAIAMFAGFWLARTLLRSREQS